MQRRKQTEGVGAPNSHTAGNREGQDLNSGLMTPLFASYYDSHPIRKISFLGFMAQKPQVSLLIKLPAPLRVEGHHFPPGLVQGCTEDANEQ